MAAAPAVVEPPLDWMLLFDRFLSRQAHNRLVEARSALFPFRGLGTMLSVSAVFGSNIVVISGFFCQFLCSVSALLLQAIGTENVYKEKITACEEGY